MPPNPYSLIPTPAPHEPPLDMFGADAVERWFTENEVSEIMALTKNLAIISR